MSDSRIFIITGGRGSGKTTLCAKVHGEARKIGLDTAGIFSPAIFENGEKTGISAYDARTGITRLLAKKNGGQAPNSGIGGLSPGMSPDMSPEIRTKMWDFDETTLIWGNSIFSAACPCQILFVDEIGPLELERGQGWTSALRAIQSGLYRSCLFVMRPELLSRALELFPGATVVDLGKECPKAFFFLDA